MSNAHSDQEAGVLGRIQSDEDDGGRRGARSGVQRSEFRQILDQRLVLGEIGEDEYRRLLGLIGEGPPAAAPASAAPPLPQSAAPTAPADTPARGFYLGRLGRGELRLWTTVWEWGCLGTLILTICMAAAIRSMAIEPAALLATVTFVWLYFISVATFRSARAYRLRNPHRQGAGFAQLLMVAVVLCSGTFIVKSMPPWQAGGPSTLPRQAAVPSGPATPTVIRPPETPQGSLDEVERIVANYNRALPRMVSPEQRADGAFLHERDLSFSFTMMGPPDHPPLPDLQQSRRFTLKEWCSESSMRALAKITYRFRNTTGALLDSYSISHSDCP